MPTLSTTEIKAIAKLLKSQDEITTKLMEEQLKTFDNRLLREIDKEISPSDIELKNYFLNLVFNTKREQLKNDFLKWSTNGTNLQEGVFLIALFDNPLMDTEYYSNLITKWTNTLGNTLKEITSTDKSTSIINEINHFMFMEIGLKGNKESYYDPRNSFIDKVLERKLGNPILLSVTYLLITNKLGLPFRGVNMPAHFLVQYADGYDPIFVDPFNQGEIITRAACQDRIRALKLVWQEDYLSCPTNKQIIARIMQNLINVYTQEEKFELKEYLESYVNVLKKV